MPANPAAHCAPAPPAASSSSARRSPPRRSRTPPSTATAACSPATMSGSTPAALVPSRPTSTPPAGPRADTSRTRCWPPPRTTTSAARTCAPAWRCISEIPDAWQATVQRWMEANARTPPRGGTVARRRGQLYQMIVGAWPMTLSADDAAGCKDFAERLAGWQQKAIREAKLQGDWTGPDEAYEAAARDFLFSPAGARQRVSPRRPLVSSAASLAAGRGERPGADPVEADGRPACRTSSRAPSSGISAWWILTTAGRGFRRPHPRRCADGSRRLAPSRAHGATGRVKQAVIARTLALRRAVPELFARGDYMPLEATGALARHVVAFARARADGRQPDGRASPAAPPAERRRRDHAFAGGMAGYRAALPARTGRPPPA